MPENVGHICRASSAAFPTRPPSGIAARATILLALAAAGAVLSPTPSARADAGPCTSSDLVVTCTYSFTGDERQFTVPAGTSAVDYRVVGAPGGGDGETYTGGPIEGLFGGRGAAVSGSFDTSRFSPGTVLTLEVGGPPTSAGCRHSIPCNGGYDGGGGADPTLGGFGGGGASQIRYRVIPAAALTPLVVAAGGGGAGQDVNVDAGDSGGDAGAAGADTGAASGGGPGQPVGPGTAGSPNGHPGARDAGGDARSGGGGGGGYWGGGGGGDANVTFDSAGEPTDYFNGAGGGGGSSLNLPAGPDAETSFTLDDDRVPMIVLSYRVAPQTITFTSAPPAPATVGSTYTVTATGGDSGQPVTFSTGTPSVCTVSGSTVSFVDAGRCAIDADQTGDAIYPAATRATQTFTIDAVAMPQAITFTSSPGNAVYGSQYGISARGGGSGEPVTFTTGSPLVCMISGAQVTYVATGTCVIDADQAAGSGYAAAPTAAQSITVHPATLKVVPFSTSSAITYGDPDPGFFPDILGLVSHDDARAITTLPTCGISGPHRNAGTYTITCSGGAAKNYIFDETPTGRLIIKPAALTIAVTGATKTYGQQNPAFTVAYTGLTGGDTASALTGTIAFTTAADATSGVGDYPVVASGATSPNYAISYKAGTLTIVPAASATKVHASADTSQYGQAVTFTARVEPVPSGTGQATGTVTFADGATTLGTAKLSDGSAELTTTTLSVGRHVITVAYGGDPNVKGSTGDASTTVSKARTTLVAASTSGLLPTFQATLTRTFDTRPLAGETVSFSVAGHVVGTATTDARGVATYKPTLAVFVFDASYTASFDGDGTDLPSTATAPIRGLVPTRAPS